MKYSEQKKLSVVEDYCSGHGGLIAVAERHGVDVSAMRRWIAAYQMHGAEGIKKKKRGASYSTEFKLAVLQRMRADGLSYRQTSALFDIRSFNIIRDWELRYDEGRLEKQSPQPNAHHMKISKSAIQQPPPVEADNRTRQELIDELDYLRMENAYLKSSMPWFKRKNKLRKRNSANSA
jgi:transposase